MTDRDSVDFGGITCREFAELVTEYLEDRLDGDTHRPMAAAWAPRARFEQHVAVRPGCARYLDQIRQSTRVLGRVTLDSISPAARDQLMDAFRTWRSGRPGDAGLG